MTSATGTNLQLGKIVTPRGTFGPRHSRATAEQMEVALRILQGPAGYSTDLERCVICVEDRLDAAGQRKHAARLAGGALALCLMHNFLYGGAHLSDSVAELRKLRHYLVFHDDCGALQLALTVIQERLIDMDTAGYTVLKRLGVPTPQAARQRIADWAVGVPDDYVDVENAMAAADEVEAIVGVHNAVAVAVSMTDGEAFVAGPELSQATNGLLAFAFTPWAARQFSNAIGVSREDQRVATLLGQVFTAEVLLQLGGSDLQVVVR